MVRHQAALASGKLTRDPSGVNLPPSEVIMSSWLYEVRMMTGREAGTEVSSAVLAESQDSR
jgi:hypothetical protein